MEESVVGSIGAGALVLVGVAEGDTQEDAEYLSRKTALLRIFSDGNGRMNESIEAVDGSYLVVSQFTLYGDCRKGNRPSYIEAAKPEAGSAGDDAYVLALMKFGRPVYSGTYLA